MQSILFVLVLTCLVETVSPVTVCLFGPPCAPNFSYDRNAKEGPPRWSSLASCAHLCNNGNKQSPINIIPENTKEDPELILLTLSPSSHTIRVKVANRRHHTPEFVFDETIQPQKLYAWNKENIKGKYSLEALHLHIGNESSVEEGSEHSIDGKFTPMEAHLKFVQQSGEVRQNFSAEDRSCAGDPAFVIGVLLEVDDEGFGEEPEEDECKQILSGQDVMLDEEETEEEEETESDECEERKAVRISRILECAYRSEEVREYQSQPTKELPVWLTPEDLLPSKNNRQYYAYDGSVTTPGCEENAKWAVLKCPVTVSERVLIALQNVEAGNGRLLGKYGLQRPIQKNTNDVYEFPFREN